MAQRAVPAPFLTKTYELVEDRRTDDVVSWNEEGTAFVVWKTADFARDLLPSYFKHNNFSSFVRQLNTYGFRKTASEKWEFANENFKRGQKELLTDIHRRKTLSAGKSVAAGGLPSPTNSGEDFGSSSTSSPDSKSPGSVETPAATALTDENEKLKKENQMLSSELAKTKTQCDELIAFLTQRVKVGPDQINRIMKTTSVIDGAGNDEEDDDNDENKGKEEEEEEENEEGSLKLFGVWLKGKNKKRGRDENMKFYGDQRKELKSMEFQAPWMRISSSSGEASKVCI